MLAKVAAALPFAFCRKETMELSKKFDSVDILPIGEDVKHLDEPNDNVINMITAVYLRDSLVNDMLFAEQEHK